MSDRRREKELKRKHKKERAAAAPAPGASAPAASRELVARELGDPARLLVHLRRLSELLTMMEELRPLRLAQDRLLPALLALSPNEVAALPENERGLKLRELILPGLVDDSQARAARAGFESALKKARSQEDQLALFAGRTFMDQWLRAKGPVQHNPSWDALFGISVLDSLFEGHLLSAVVRGGWEVDEGGAAKGFAKALAKAEVASELENLGLTERDPQALARQYGEVARLQGKTYLLGFDALLHLVQANHRLAAKSVRVVLGEGANAEVRRSFQEAFAASYKEDVTAPLVADLANEIARRLGAIKKGEGDAAAPKKPQDAKTREDEKRIALVALASIRALPVDRNAVLKNTYLSSFEVYKNVAPVEEVPFIRRVWGEPSDRWALEEYEKFLMERRQSHRAGRVHRFLTEVRAELKEKEAEQAKSAPAS